MSKFTVGQKVIMRTRRHPDKHFDTTVEIIRVGRRYAYVWLYGREHPFNIETGWEKSDFTPNVRIGTAEMFAEFDRHEEAKKRLTELTRSYGWMSHLSSDALTKIADTIEEVQR